MTVVAGMATIYSRQTIARQAIESLLPQVDILYVVLNNYPDYPEWMLAERKIRPVLGHNTFGDAGKFMFAHLHPDSYFLSVDDDLLYLPGYVDYMIAGEQKHQSIVTLHGKTYRVPIRSYRRDIFLNLPCLQANLKDTVVHVGGTGVMCFHTSRFNVTLEDLAHRNMADVLIAQLAMRQGVKIVTLAHKGDYLKYLYPGKETIWNASDNDSIQTVIINSMLKRTPPQGRGH